MSEPASVSFAVAYGSSSASYCASGSALCVFGVTLVICVTVIAVAGIVCYFAFGQKGRRQ